MANHFLGIDIGGTRIKWCITDDLGKVIKQGVMDTEDKTEGTSVWRENILRLIERHNEKTFGQGNNLFCGISAPGLVDDENRMILHMPKRLKGIENFNWTEACNKKVAVLNDGHAATLAEYESQYIQKGIKHLLMLTLGTGVGGGIIIDGKLYQGHLQRAGHVGHISLDTRGAPTMTNMPGSLEYEVGNFSVGERTRGMFQSTKALVEAYEKGDDAAKTFWLTSISKLAAGLASLTNVLAPECIVLGGGIVTGAGDSLIQPLNHCLNEVEWRPGGQKINIQLATLGDFAGALGAALFARKTMNS